MLKNYQIKALLVVCLMAIFGGGECVGTNYGDPGLIFSS